MKTKYAVVSFFVFTLAACGFNLPEPPGQVSAQWQSPANYSRTPGGTNPVDPITFSVDFTDMTGCPNQTFRFWLFQEDGVTPVSGIGSNGKPLLGSRFEQTAHLPINMPVYTVRLACTKANGDRYSMSSILEQGSPAFTPRTAISWQTPNAYTRTPSGPNPTNPMTFSAQFTDESGCLSQMYRFWAYGQNGVSIGGIGNVMTLQNFGVTITTTLPPGVPIYAVRLACVDGDGNISDTSSNLEFGLPAFTPGGSPNDAGMPDVRMPDVGAESGSANCPPGGYWTGPFCDGPFSGDCMRASTQSDCVSSNNSCYWDTDHCAYNPGDGGAGLCGDIPIGTTCNTTPSCSWNAGVCVVQTDAGEACSSGGGYWTGPFCDGPYSGDCMRSATESECTSHSSCLWSSNHCVYRGGDGLCGDVQTHAACDGTYSCSWNSGVCIEQNPDAGGTGTCTGQSTTLCTTPENSTSCGTCGGYWTGAFCDDHPNSGHLYSGACMRAATETECTTVQPFCSWSTNHCAYVQSPQNGLCGDVDTAQACNPIATCTWNTGLCIGQYLNFCTTPSNESACVACGGTWQ